MIRVVIDTNVLVSALLQPGGLPAAVLLLALSDRVQPCVSEAVLAEYQEVLRPFQARRRRDPRRSSSHAQSFATREADNACERM